MASLRILRSEKKKFVQVLLPASKSISTRLCVLKALYPDKIHVENMSEADDVRLMEKNLNAIKTCSDSSIPLVIDAGNSGAVMRFLTAYASVYPGKRLITGSKRLKERPLGPLVDSLKSLEADIQYAGEAGFIPLLINGKELEGSKVSTDPGVSSQFVSALLLIANELPDGLELILEKEAASGGYIDLTIGILKKAGIRIEHLNEAIILRKSKLEKTTYHVESDWASASFWYEFVCFSPDTEIILKGLERKSSQPEAILPELFAMLGAETTFDVDGISIRKVSAPLKKISYDFRDNPDLALPFITATALGGSDAYFSGLENLKYKESDRLDALIDLLTRLSVALDTDAKTKISLKRSEAGLPESINFNCRNDHRLIMTAAPLAIVLRKGIVLKEHHGLEKSYPGYWDDLQASGLELQPSNH